jgi:hypothetical protein
MYIFQLEEELERLKLSRKWFMFVLFLLYAGLFASFSLNVTLLIPTICGYLQCGRFYLKVFS